MLIMLIIMIMMMLMETITDMHIVCNIIRLHIRLYIMTMVNERRDGITKS